MEFSHELALALFQSTDPFPVDFEQAWRWIGYSTKQKAKDKLFNNFEGCVDYVISLNQTVKRTGRGGQNREDIRLSIDCLKSLGMMAGTQKGKEIRHYFLECERIAKLLVVTQNPQAQEIERMKLKLHLIQAKQKYLDVCYAIQLSTSSAMLNYLRGDAPPPKEVEHVKHFVDTRTGREVGSTEGRSLTQLIADAGLNPKSKRDKDRVKSALKRRGFDYDRMEIWSEASYLRKYPVLEDKVYDQALKAVLSEVMDSESEQNLFVHQMQQAALSPQKQPRAFQGVEP